MIIVYSEYFDIVAVLRTNRDNEATIFSEAKKVKADKGLPTMESKQGQNKLVLQYEENYKITIEKT